MTELTDFLLARIAEDVSYLTGGGRSAPDPYPTSGVNGLMWEHDGLDSAGRLLAECEAKRRIVGLHPEILTICQGCGESYPCRTLHALALPYAGHSDYRPEWRL